MLSIIRDGLQLSASIDSFGHSISLDDVEDVEDVENPSVALSAVGGGLIDIDGTSTSAIRWRVDLTFSCTDRGSSIRSRG